MAKLKLWGCFVLWALTRRLYAQDAPLPKLISQRTIVGTDAPSQK
jgi:hypothetical protein